MKEEGRNKEERSIRESLEEPETTLPKIFLEGDPSVQWTICMLLRSVESHVKDKDA